MHEEILPDLYRIDIPLPRNPLKALNSYLIRGKDRFLIIDTGMNREECRSAMFGSLEKLGVDLNRTDFYITHIHVDHLGLASTLATRTSKVYFNETEAKMIGHIKPSGEDYETTYFSHGFPREEFKLAVAAHPSVRYKSDINFDFSPVKDGDTIDIGSYSFQCISTPGHSPGHMCLYEASKKILVAGDHILFDITPHIAWWPHFENSLKKYLESLKKIDSFDIALLLPGHRRLLKNHHKRIQELQEHHQSRLNEILTTLNEGAKTAYQVAPHITWDLDCESWEEFPLIQKWFAMNETIAHVLYLEAEGRILPERRDGQIFYSPAK